MNRRRGRPSGYRPGIRACSGLDPVPGFHPPHPIADHRFTRFARPVERQLEKIVRLQALLARTALGDDPGSEQTEA
jgi:hypothetical protein